MWHASPCKVNISSCVNYEFRQRLINESFS